MQGTVPLAVITIPFLQLTCLKSEDLLSASRLLHRALPFLPQTDLVLIVAVGIHAPLNVPGSALAFVSDSPPLSASSFN